MSQYIIKSWRGVPDGDELVGGDGIVHVTCGEQIAPHMVDWELRSLPKHFDMMVVDNGNDGFWIILDHKGGRFQGKGRQKKEKDK